MEKAECAISRDIKIAPRRDRIVSRRLRRRRRRRVASLFLTRLPCARRSCPRIRRCQDLPLRAAAVASTYKTQDAEDERAGGGDGGRQRERRRREKEKTSGRTRPLVLPSQIRRTLAAVGKMARMRESRNPGPDTHIHTHTHTVVYSLRSRPAPAAIRW